jgi:C4-dicarboxylate transporter, DctM subunit
MRKNMLTYLNKIEEGGALAALAAVIVLLTLDIILRFFKASIFSGYLYIRNIVVWLTFVSMLVTTKQRKHLSISLGFHDKNEKFKLIVETIVSFICVTIGTALSVSAISLYFSFQPGENVGIIPIFIVISIIPLCFIVLVARLIAQAPPRVASKIIAALGIVMGIFLSLKEILFVLQSTVLVFEPDNTTAYDTYQKIIEGADVFYVPVMNFLFLPFLVIFIASAFFGTPIFVVLGGLAVLLFAQLGRIGGLSSIPLSAYATLCREDIPAIPLFTFVGFILSSSKAGERLVKFLQALIGWIPGGLAIVTIVICAFFTTFTGASGITILALGGLLAGMLVNKNYSSSYSHGLITGSGAIGLLFPPSLPLIMYGVASMVSIKDLFIGAFIPGLLVCGSLCVMSIIYAVKNKVERAPFRLKDLPGPFFESLWDSLLPIIILVAFFTGIITPVETGALAVIYAIVIEVFVYKDIKLRELPGVMLKGIPVIGGVLIIIAMASGLQSYIVDQDIPQKLADLSFTFIKSPFLFLLLLNVLLLIVGCMMDIFSAIIVVAPLVIPLGVLYGINPVHLGVIFLSNLMLGFITPPVGMSLFIASYRFETPLLKITKYTIPFFLVLLGVVILITYVPWLSTGLLGLLAK